MDKTQLLKAVGKLSFTLRGITVTVLENTVENDLLKIVVTATKNGQTLTINNPLYYKNPPTKVPDGLTYKTDAISALKEIIVQTIELTGK